VNGPIIISPFAVKRHFLLSKTNRFSQGIEDDIDLYFKVEGPFPEAYLNFQPDDSDKLPTDSDYYYGFHVREGVQEMPALKEINGIKNFNEAILILGLKNSGSSNTNMEITYVAEEDGDDDDDDGSNWLYFQK